MQFAQVHHSMKNVKIYTCHPQNFELAFTVSELYKFKFVTLKMIVKVTECNFRNDIRKQISKSTNVYHIFCHSSYRFKFSNLLPSVSRSMSHIAFFAITPFDGIISGYTKNNSSNFFIFSLRCDLCERFY